MTAITALTLTSCYDFNRKQAEKDAESIKKDLKIYNEKFGGLELNA